MLDNRNVSLSTIAGGINFKSGDISGTAAKTADDRASQGTEYFRQEDAQNPQKETFTDRSMELRASLASLALINASCLIRNQNRRMMMLDDEEVNEKLQKDRVSKIQDENHKEKSNQEKHEGQQNQKQPPEPLTQENTEN